jgi:starch phosphorylase
VQFVFAGKAHPADEKGKAMIQEISQFSQELGIRHRFVFLEDYDIAVARALYQGADVWLNTPRRPQEACGTSGEKAALNGALNCSILDGWWDELFDGENGWAITSAEGLEDERRDAAEANTLFELIERQIVPLFYERRGTSPRGWLRRVKHAFATLGPAVVATRMVKDYVRFLYEPAASHDAALGGEGGFGPASELAAWKARVAAGWQGVHVDDVTVETEPAEVGSTRTVTADVALGNLTPDDVEVQLVRGTVVGDGELVDTHCTAMAPGGEATGGHVRYTALLPCERAGRHGVTVRVVPSHPLLANPMELGRVAWPA